MLTESEIEKVVPRWTSLSAAANGFATKTLIGNDYEHGFVPETELTKLDPRLPAALRVYEEDGPNVYGIIVSHMLRLWSTDTFVISTNGERYAIAEVTDILFSRTEVHIQGDGYRYNVRKHPDTGEALHIPAGPAPKAVPVAKAWLDQNHPGWRERYRIASDLGMSKYEALQAMVSLPSIQLSVEIPADISPTG